MIALPINRFTDYFDNLNPKWANQYDPNIVPVGSMEDTFFEWLTYQKIDSKFQRITNHHFRVRDRIYSVTTEPLFVITNRDMRKIEEGDPYETHNAFSLVVSEMVKSRISLIQNKQVSHSQIYDYIKKWKNPSVYILELFIDNEFEPVMYSQYFIAD